jgi:hypothetical protein
MSKRLCHDLHRFDGASGSGPPLEIGRLQAMDAPLSRGMTRVFSIL